MSEAEVSSSENLTLTKVTRRAEIGSEITLMPYREIVGCTVSHTLPLPAMCPFSSNPLSGSTITITYTPDQHTLEVVALATFLAGFVGGRLWQGIEVISMEQVPEVVAVCCASALRVPVFVSADLAINPDQHMRIETSA